jgi:hypothetical protein
MRLQQLQERNANMANKTLSKLSNNFTWGFEFEIAYTDEINDNYFDFETYDEASDYWYVNIRPKQIKDIVKSYFNKFINGDRTKLKNILKNCSLKNDWEYDKTTFSEIVKYDEDDNEIDRYDLYNCNSLKELFEYVDCNEIDIVDLFKKDEYYMDNENDYYIEWLDEQRVAESEEITNNAVEIIRELFQEDLPVYRNWNVVSDSSIRPTGAEIVTPVLKYDNAIAALENVFDFIHNNQELETNSSTGLHINVGTWKGEEQNKIDLLKFLLFFNDVYVAKIFNRLTFNDKNYAETLTNKIKKFRQDNTTTLFNANLNDALIRQLNDKYQTVNFNKFKELGYLEIRAPGNVDYHKDLDKIKMVMGRIAQALTIASDPNAYANEYGKKLSKLIDLDDDEKSLNFNSDIIHALIVIKNYFAYNNPTAENLKKIALNFKEKFYPISLDDLELVNERLSRWFEFEENLKLEKYIQLLIKIVSKK